MVMLALGLIYTIGLSLVGIDLAVLIGMGAGLLSIVPYLGSIVGVLVAVPVPPFSSFRMYFTWSWYCLFLPWARQPRVCT